MLLFIYFNSILSSLSMKLKNKRLEEIEAAAHILPHFSNWVPPIGSPRCKLQGQMGLFIDGGKRKLVQLEG